MVVTVGGFYPGFNPEPARLPALRRVGLAMDNPLPIIEIRAEGYFAVTSNSIQLGGRWEIGISLGIEAHGFVQVDAIVQFRPFHFDARIAAGFDVSAGGFSFASVTLEGSIAGPGPIVIHGSLSIDVFLFSISWSETFTLGSGPSDTLPAAPLLIDVDRRRTEQGRERAQRQHRRSARRAARRVRELVGSPRYRRPARCRCSSAAPRSASSSSGSTAGRSPAPQGVKITGGTTDVTDRFSPGSYVTLTDAEALNRPPFDILACGRVLSLADPLLSEGKIDDPRQVDADRDRRPGS